MTMSPGSPGPTDFEGKAVPPYEGRRETADVDGEEELREGRRQRRWRDRPGRERREEGARARGHPRGAVASPSDERPAGQATTGRGLGRGRPTSRELPGRG